MQTFKNNIEQLRGFEVKLIAAIIVALFIVFTYITKPTYTLVVSNYVNGTLTPIASYRDLDECNKSANTFTNAKLNQAGMCVLVK